MNGNFCLKMEIVFETKFLFILVIKTMDTLFPNHETIFLTQNDFKISKDKILTLKENKTVVVLFYSDNNSSKKLVSMFNSLSKKILPGSLSKYNTDLNDEKLNFKHDILYVDNGVKEIFNQKNIPIIIGYKNGAPVSVFNETMTEFNLLNFTSQLLCPTCHNE